MAELQWAVPARFYHYADAKKRRDACRQLYTRFSGRSVIAPECTNDGKRRQQWGDTNGQQVSFNQMKYQLDVDKMGKVRSLLLLERC